MRVARFFVGTQDESTKKDYTEQVTNTLKDSENVATLISTAAGQDGNALMLLHCDGSDGGTTFTDAIGTHTIAAQGNAQTDTGITKDGFSQSCLLDGTGDYLEIDDHADFDFSGGTWSLDMWIYPDNDTETGSLWHQDLIADATTYIELYLSGGNVAIDIDEAGSVTTIATTVNQPCYNGGRWYHIQFVESGNDYYIFVDGVLQIQTSSAKRFVDYDEKVHMGSGPSGDFDGNIDEIRLSDIARNTSSFVPAFTPHGTATNAFMLVGATRPIQGAKFYIQTANTTSGTLTVYQWSTSGWEEVTITDGTVVSGAPLAKTGRLTGTGSISIAQPKLFDGILLYWYAVNVSDCDATTQIYHITLDAPIQQCKDIWDGTPRIVASFKHNDAGIWKDYTLNVFDDHYDSLNEGTFADISSAEAADYLVVGFAEPMMGINIVFEASNVNTNATGLGVSYWDGNAWIPVSNLDDQTRITTTTFAQTGTLSWNQLSTVSEFQTEIADEVPLYYYKLTWSAQLSATIQIIHMWGIPSPKAIRGYKFPMFADDRLMLCNNADKDKNAVLVSNRYAPDVWNGDDSTTLFIGNGTELTAGTQLYSRLGSNIYDVKLFFKKDAIYGLTGSSPQNYIQYTISENIGCVAPLTLQTTVLTIENKISRPVAIFQASDGLYMFDNTSPIKISRDIDNFFDPNESNTRKIHSRYLQDSVGFVDEEKREYHWLFSDGASTSRTLNREFVFDLERFKWFEIDRGTAKNLQCGFPVYSENGDTFTYGCLDTGHMYRLENGTTMDTVDIVHTLWTSDFAPVKGSIMRLTQMEKMKLIQRNNFGNGSSYTLCRWTRYRYFACG
jgi:hypothetical protein